MFLLYCKSEHEIITLERCHPLRLKLKKKYWCAIISPRDSAFSTRCASLFSTSQQSFSSLLRDFFRQHEMMMKPFRPPLMQKRPPQVSRNDAILHAVEDPPTKRRRVSQDQMQVESLHSVREAPKASQTPRQPLSTKENLRVSQTGNASINKSAQSCYSVLWSVYQRQIALNK
jgi:hypothetical protein